MGKRKTTFGVSRRQLAKLWAAGEDTPDDTSHPEDDEARRQSLHDGLAEALPLDPAMAKVLPEILGRLCEQLRPFASASLGRLLTDPNTDVEVLTKIHDLQKQAAQAAETQARREAATAIYYGAIAAALVHHNRRITRFSCTSLRDAFTAMLETGWVAPDLADLFQKARTMCEAEIRARR